jgi:putative ABC transport system permease protein
VNPFPIVLATIRKTPWMTLAFVLLVGLSTGLGVAMTSQERALRTGSAKAADRFEILVSAPGSQTDIMLKTVFLQPGTVELLAPEIADEVLSDPKASFAAPLGFGDSYNGDAVVGTTKDLILALSGGTLAEGRMFETWEEAIVGSASPLRLGDHFKSVHGHGEDSAEEAHEHGSELTIVGRMATTGSPWDRAIILPIEQIWRVHNLPSGHPPTSGELLGPPFVREFLAPVPAIVVKAQSIADAYGLRGKYRTEKSTAFFPAEVLIELYGLMGDIRVLMSALALGTQVLVIASILTSIVILLRLQRKQFAILRALGAPRRYILAVVWIYVAIIVVTGAALGLVLGWLMSFGVSHFVSVSTGVSLQPWIGWPEIRLALGVVFAGFLLALLPLMALYRTPVAEALRGE